MKKKPWFIVLSIFAFPPLVFSTLARITAFENENNICEQNSLKRKVLRDSIVLALTAIILPTVIILFASLTLLGLLTYVSTGNYLEATNLAYILMLICVYLCGVYATYKLVRWREKYIPHMLRRPR